MQVSGGRLSPGERRANIKTQRGIKKRAEQDRILRTRRDEVRTFTGSPLPRKALEGLGLHSR